MALEIKNRNNSILVSITRVCLYTKYGPMFKNNYNDGA